MLALKFFWALKLIFHLFDQWDDWNSALHRDEVQKGCLWKYLKLSHYRGKPSTPFSYKNKLCKNNEAKINKKWKQIKNYFETEKFLNKKSK